MTGDVDLPGLEAEADTELQMVRNSFDPAGMEPPETQAYEVRLHSLHDSIVAAETR